VSFCIIRQCIIECEFWTGGVILISGAGARLNHCISQLLNDLVGSDTSSAMYNRANSSELINHREHTYLPAIYINDQDEVVAPNMITMRRE
jgi:hypothetical protein